MSSIGHHHDVVIVGLGPVGAALALLISHHLGPFSHNDAISIALVERHDGDDDKLTPRAVALDDDVLRNVIQKLGLLDDFIKISDVMPNLQFATGWSIANDDSPKYIFGYLPREISSKLKVGKLNRDDVVLGDPQRGEWVRESEESNTAEIPSQRTTNVNGFFTGGMSYWGPELERILRDRIRRDPRITLITGEEVVEVSTANAAFVEVITSPSTPPHHQWHQDEGREWTYGPTPSSTAETTTTTTRRRRTCRYLIGCDGARSSVRRLTFPRSVVRSLEYDRQWLAMDVALLPNSPGAHRLSPYCQHLVYPREGRQIIMIYGTSRSRDPQMRGGLRHLRFDVELCLPADARTLAEKGRLVFCEDVLRRFGLVPDVDYHTLRAATYTFHAWICERWIRFSGASGGGEGPAGVMLCGDARGVMPPFLGQGLNSGLKDASDLAWRLAGVMRFADTTPSDRCRDLLMGYEKRRKPLVDRAIRYTVAVGRTAEAIEKGEEFRNGMVASLAGEIETLDDDEEEGRTTATSKSSKFKGGDVLARYYSKSGAGRRIFPQTARREDDSFFNSEGMRGYSCYAIVVGSGNDGDLMRRVDALMKEINGVVIVVDSRESGASVVFVDPDRAVIGEWRMSEGDARLRGVCEEVRRVIGLCATSGVSRL